MVACKRWRLMCFQKIYRSFIRYTIRIGGNLNYVKCWTKLPLMNDYLKLMWITSHSHRCTLPAVPCLSGVSLPVSAGTIHSSYGRPPTSSLFSSPLMPTAFDHVAAMLRILQVCLCAPSLLPTALAPLLCQSRGHPPVRLATSCGLSPSLLLTPPLRSAASPYHRTSLRWESPPRSIFTDSVPPLPGLLTQLFLELSVGNYK